MIAAGAVARVRDAAPIAEVVARYVSLRPAGTDALAGLCPFHKEKTPSFMVSPGKGLWHCHGCHAGGDVYTFVERMERVPFAQALRILADRYGVSLEERPLTRSEIAEERRRRAYIEEVSKEAVIWWRHVLHCYESRFERLVAQAFACSDADDEAGYQAWARRAWRWGKIVRRLVAILPADLFRRYERVRMRPSVAAYVKSRQAVDREVLEVWHRIVAAARAGYVSEAQIWKMCAAVFSRSATLAVTALRSGSDGLGSERDW